MNIALEYTVDYNVDHHCLCYILNQIRLKVLGQILIFLYCYVVVSQC